MINSQIKAFLNDFFTLHSLLRKLITRPFRSHSNRDVTTTQLFILFLLTTDKLMNMSELCEKACVSKQQMTKLINELVEKDYVQRFRSDDNRRVVLVMLTDHGQAYLQAIRKKGESALVPLFEVLSDSEIQSLSDAMHTITNLLSIVDKKRNPTQAE